MSPIKISAAPQLDKKYNTAEDAVDLFLFALGYQLNPQEPSGSDTIKESCLTK